jgi:hypothetical protein
VSFEGAAVFYVDDDDGGGPTYHFEGGAKDPADTHWHHVIWDYGKCGEVQKAAVHSQIFYYQQWIRNITNL